MSDESFLCNAKPRDAQQAAVCKLVENTLEPPALRDVALSAGKGKRENFKRPLPQPTAKNREGAVRKLPAPFFLVETEIGRVQLA